MDPHQTNGRNNLLPTKKTDAQCPPMSGFVHRDVPEDVLKCPPVSADVRKCPDLSAHLKNCGTNPTVGNSGLSPRQLAAARMIVQGMKPAAVASLLRTTDRTIRRWQALPYFQAELRRLHDLMVAPVQASQAAPAKRASEKIREHSRARPMTLRERLEREYANKPFEVL